MFRRDLHVEWARALERLERHEEAAREYGVALAVPALFDPDHIVFVGPEESLPPGVDRTAIPPGLLGEIPPDQLQPVPLTKKERAELEEARGAL